MKISGKFILKVAGTLTAISLVVAALLGFVNSITKDKIAAIDAENTRVAMSAVAPEGSEFGDKMELSEAAITAASDNGGKLVELYPVTLDGAAAGYVMKISASGSQGAIVMMVGVDANKAITEACQNAERALKVKNSFIKSIRHEIRTPLNGIVGFAQVLTSMFDNNEECKQMTDVIIEKSNQLTKIIDDVLYVSDIQNIPLSIEHFKLGDIISETIGNYKPLLREGGSITASSGIMEI